MQKRLWSLPTVEPVANFLGGSVVPEFMALSPEVHGVRECQELVSIQSGMCKGGRERRKHDEKPGKTDWTFRISYAEGRSYITKSWEDSFTK